MFFRDRGAAIAAPDSFATPRALARREKAWAARAARGITTPRVGAEDDAPPSAAYLAALDAAGARLRFVSRWLNAASVDADSAELAAIRALPFVAEIRPVARLAADLDSAIAGEPPVTPPIGDGAADAADAGPSYAQLEAIGIPEAHALGYLGDGVLIGILDSGFSTRHEALRRLDVRGVRDFVQKDDDTEDDPSRTPPDPPGQQNHGTQCLSLIGAYRPGSMLGAAPRASFLLAKTERTGVEIPAEEDDWCAGVEWAEAMGADVITTSLSYDNWYRVAQLDGRTAVTTKMANLAWERGVVILNSAGNEGPGARTIGAPGDAAGEITVGAVNLQGQIVGFSSRGPTGDGRVKPDVVAPGTGVLVVLGGALDGYQRGGGTSYSTPLVAGVAALVVEAHPDWGPEAVREAIVMSASRADRPDNDYGWGIVNARAAILYPLLEGRVTSREGGAPLAGARVGWERVGESKGEWAAPGDAPPNGETRTDAGGNYTIANLPPGSYRLTISAEGHDPAALGPFDVPPNLGGVDATLAPRR
ncbi:MAG TPA: S8 family serine peptidase [Candidatus Eisenbacteria bacterium]|nr:S8 family serine peptidase [Candidatus Eisenbacteria bacterium]